jgi:hypothetical protein
MVTKSGRLEIEKDEGPFSENLNRKYAANIMENFSNEIDTINDSIETSIKKINC